MRIVQVANFVREGSGGIATVLTALQYEYVLNGHDVICIVPGRGTMLNTSEHGRIRISSVLLPLSGGYRVILFRRKLKTILTSLRPDVVEIHDTSTLYWLPKWCSSRGIRHLVISHERTDLVVQNVPVLRWPLWAIVGYFRKRIEHSAQSIVCASQFAADEFSHAQNNVVVVPLAVDLEVFTPQGLPREWRSQPVVTICSRLSIEKGIDIAIAGFAEFASRHSACLRIIGDGPLREEVERWCEGLDATFMGYVSDRSMLALALASTDVVLNMGPMETFGLATLEALASGTPVVVSDTGASPEIVDSTVGISTPNNATRVADALEQLLNHDRLVMSRCARERAENFSWSLTARRLLALAMTGKSDATLVH